MNEIFDEISSVGKEAGDIVLDEILDNDVVQKIPVVGWSFSALKLTKSINDRIFTHKLNKFIKNIDSKKEWKEKFSNLDECEKISKKLLFLINAINDDKKIDYLAKIFCDYVNDVISKNDFLFYSEILERLYIPFLEEIDKFSETEEYQYFTISEDLKIIFAHLQANNLFEQGPGISEFGSPYIINSVGKYFKSIVLELKNDV